MAYMLIITHNLLQVHSSNYFVRRHFFINSEDHSHYSLMLVTLRDQKQICLVSYESTKAVVRTGTSFYKHLFK